MNHELLNEKTDEIPVGNVGPFQISVVQRDLEQVLIVRGYKSDALPVLLRRLGLEVQELGPSACSLPHDVTTDQVLVELFDLVCRLRYMRPTFGQLVLFDELAEVAT